MPNADTEPGGKPSEEKPDSRVKEFVEKVLEGTVVKLVVLALVAGFGYLLGARNEQVRYVQRVRSAPEEYVGLLKAQIESASRDEPVNIRVRARSIIRVRDSLGGSLLNLSKQLDSEIDRLAQLLDKYEQGPSEQLDTEIHDSIAVLQRTWPAKEKLIVYELRKVVAELGLDRVIP